MDWVLTVSDQPELLVQVVQFCRLLQRLSRLLDTSLPARIEDAIGGYIWRELRSGVLLKPGCAPSLLRGTADPSAPRAPLASNYDVLCVLDLAAAHLLRTGPPKPASGASDGSPSGSNGVGGGSHVPHDDDEESASDGGARKRPRIDEGTRSVPPPDPHPSWLVWLLGLPEKHHATGSSNSTGMAVALPTDGAGWTRRLLVLSAILKRHAQWPLPGVSIAVAARTITPLATRSVDAPELLLCALFTLLALVPRTQRQGDDHGSPRWAADCTDVKPLQSADWEEVWAQVWAAERALWTLDEPTTGKAAAITAACAALQSMHGQTVLLSEMRQRLLSRLFLSGLVAPASLAAAAEEATRGCLATANVGSIQRCSLASCLLSAWSSHRHHGGGHAAMDVDGLGDDSTLTVTDVLGGEWTPPYDVNSLMIADAAMPLHPACLVCCETHRDTLAGATGLWASTRLQLALAVAGIPLDRMAPALSVPLTPLHSLSSAVAAAPALPPSTARLWCDFGWCRPLNGASLAAASDDTAAAATSLESASAAGYVEMIARGEAMDSDACTVAQAEVELLHLDNACTEAMRARDGDGGGAHGIAEVARSTAARRAHRHARWRRLPPAQCLAQLMGASPGSQPPSLANGLRLSTPPAAGLRRDAALHGAAFTRGRARPQPPGDRVGEVHGSDVRRPRRNARGEGPRDAASAQPRPRSCPSPYQSAR